jgi:hypothetical protein
VIAFRSLPVYRAWNLFEQDAVGRYNTITVVFGVFDPKV